MSFPEADYSLSWPSGASKALTALNDSLGRDSATPHSGAEDRQAFLDSARDELRTLVIDPVMVTVLTSDWGREYGELKAPCYEMVAVAGRDKQWLLYDPVSTLFSLAIGELTGELVLVGYRYDDALAEWRG